MLHEVTVVTPADDTSSRSSLAWALGVFDALHDDDLFAAYHATDDLFNPHPMEVPYTTAYRYSPAEQAQAMLYFLLYAVRSSTPPTSER